MLSTNKTYESFVFSSVLIILALLGLNFVSYVFATGFFAFVALTLFCLFCFLLFKVSPTTFMLLLFFLFFRLTTLVSGVFIESGAYMVELGMDGVATGAYIRLTLIYILFTLITAIFIEKYNKPNELITNQYNLIGLERLFIVCSYIFLAGLFVYLFVLGIRQGFPILSGVDRFVFKNTLSDFFLTQFIQARFIIASILGFMFAISSGSEKKLNGAYFAIMFILSILFGEKFTSIVGMSIYFILPITILKSFDYKYLLPKIAALMIAMAIITIPTILIVYGWADDSAAAIDRFLNRAASQGQLWYAVDYDLNEMFKFDAGEFVRNIQAMISFSPATYAEQYPFLGIRSLMMDYLTPERFASYSIFNITLNFGFEAYLVRMFGYLGMLPFLVFFAFIYALNLRYLKYAITSLSPIRIFIASRLLIWVTFGLQQGELYYIIGLKTFVFLVIALVFELVMQHKNAEVTPHYSKS
jgi:hypothetical protein